MEAQTIFDRVCRHLLLDQHEQSLDYDDNCVYRAPDGMTCAVGCLFTDDEYDESMEMHGVRDLIMLEKLPLRLVPHADLLDRLQSIHDDCLPDEWFDVLDRAGASFGLKMPAKVVAEFKGARNDA